MTKYFYRDEKTGLKTTTFSSLRELLKDAFDISEGLHWRMSVNDEIVINKIYNTSDCIQIYGFNPGSGPIDGFELAEIIRSNME